jgi:hypothetical protein
MITVTGIVFSITLVTLSLTSQQFGPRLLQNFMGDRGNQFVLDSGLQEAIRESIPFALHTDQFHHRFNLPLASLLGANRKIAKRRRMPDPRKTARTYAGADVENCFEFPGFRPYSFDSQAVIAVVLDPVAVEHGDRAGLLSSQ